MKRFLAVLAMGLVVTLPCSASRGASGEHVPTITSTALNGKSVSLPEDLRRLNVVIVGFTRESADRTTAWEKPVRRELLPAGVQFYDVAVLESESKFMRTVVSTIIRNKVPTVLKPHFLMLYDGELDWKRAVGFDAHAQDDAYVVVVDADGRVLWSSHAPYSDGAFDDLKRELKRRGMR